MPNYRASMVSNNPMAGIEIIYEGTNWNAMMGQVKGHLNEVQETARFIVEIVPPPRCIANIAMSAAGSRVVRCNLLADDGHTLHEYREGKIAVVWPSE